MAGTALLKHIWALVIKNDNGNATVNGSVTLLGSNEFNQKISIAAGATAEMDCGSLPFAKMKSLFFVADQGDVDIATNAADGTGGQTFNLADANNAYAWHEGMPNDNPITANITKIYATNNSDKDCVFRVGILMDLLA